MYHFLKILVKLSLYAYFRRVRIKGKNKIKKGTPTIFISNHPSAFMDPVSVGVFIRPTIYFLAAGEYMGSGFKFWFMNKMLNMIPIYRPETMPDDTTKNNQIFEKCIEHLTKGRSILVFPEGVSSPDKRILPLKTGVARIVRATELEHGLKAGVKIIPIGLNYSDPHKFRSDLFINVGDPIDAADYLSDDPTKEQEEVKALTARMEEALIDTVLHIESTASDELLSKINDSYTRDLKTEMGIDFSDQDKEFELNKITLSAITYYEEHDKSTYEEMRSKIDRYFHLLDEHGIKDRDFRKAYDQPTLGQLIQLIFGFPFFVVGLLINFIPYQLTAWINKKLDIKDTFKGSILLAVGMILFLIYYSAIAITLGITTDLSYFAIALPFIFYLLGLQALIYRSVYSYLNKRKKLRAYLDSHPAIHEELIKERQELIDKFTELRERFDARR